MKKVKTIRCKTSSGITGSYGVQEQDDGKFRVVSAGTFKRGRTPIPSAFAPDEAHFAVGKEFDSFDDVELYLRNM